MEKNCVILYKSGKFYNAFGDNGLILHHLMGYKFVEYKQSAGFPETAFNKVINTLEKENLAYKVYNKDILITEKKGISKNYTNILKESLKKMDMEKRLNRLKTKINDFNTETLEKIIEGIESANN